MAIDVHFSSKALDWETPQAFFDTVNAEFDLQLDVCATPANAKLQAFFTPAEDALGRKWSVAYGIDDLGGCAVPLPARCWMNPPYGREIGKWMKKAYEESLMGALVVCLVPTRTDTAWWHDYAAKGEIRFVRGRLKFGGSKWNAPFPCALVIFRPPYEIWTNGRDLFSEPVQ
jgi:phage N-6-adenine-methyltransferase